MDSKSIVVALKRERNLLEQVLSLALCQLDLAEAGRLEDLEWSLILRAERMTDLRIIEAGVGAKMQEIENDLNTSPQELAELHHLNIQIISLADRIANTDERVEQLVDLADAHGSIHMQDFQIL
jgi:hypothetical protein